LAPIGRLRRPSPEKCDITPTTHRQEIELDGFADDARVAAELICQKS
jgi:hypothetical protein